MKLSTWPVVLALAMLAFSASACGSSATPTAVPGPRLLSAPAATSTPSTSATEEADNPPPPVVSTITPVFTSAVRRALATASTTSTPSTPSTPSTAIPDPVANTAANLRAGPGTNYPIIGSAQTGETLRIAARNPQGDWYQLASGAWIAAALIDRAPAVPIAAVIPASPVPATATRAVTSTPVIVVQPTAAPLPARTCCKHCGSTSKPCGDTCISLSKTCHVGVGCACP
ncbi:MAG: SH3 domain-containing protein [Candidatus Kaiserbacteria bacterium]|nr:SH3 domain-containing protein [Candidatus Kaiserbacteria bacterium]